MQKRSSIGRLRRTWHMFRGHHVLGTVMRDMRKRSERVEFYFRPAWVCIDCNHRWAR